MKNPGSSIIKLSDGEPVFRHCQWLFGEGIDRNFCRKTVARGEIWCQNHLQIVYMPQFVRKRTLKKMNKKVRE